ncbi:hypothetical protein HanRHA438_Chr08g0330001 [Helianthus annuus]|nr:hypothetical protein HanRHA438_Chr08g0330001 [Helianthus annuus]
MESDYNVYIYTITHSVLSILTGGSYYTLANSLSNGNVFQFLYKKPQHTDSN